MKLTKRLLSMLLLVCMVLSMLPAVTLTASAAATGDRFIKITSVSELSVGDEIIFVHPESTHAMSTTQNTNNRGQVSISVSGDTYTYASTSVQAVTVEEGASSGTFAFYTGSGYLYSPSANNYLRTKAAKDTTGSWNVTANSDGTMNIQCAGRTSYYMQFNKTSLVSCYKNTMKDGFIFKKAAAAHTVTASASPTAGGTVTVSGNTITAVPNSGYYVTGNYVADTGIAVTYNNDNTFTFTASASGEVVVEFAQLQPAILYYSENGTVRDGDIVYTGESVALETAQNVPTGYEFVGWLPTAYATSDTQPAGLLRAGDSYTLTAEETTLYAVYAIASGTGGAGGWAETDLSSIADGTNLVIVSTKGTSSYAMSNDKGTSAAPAATAIAISGTQLSAEPAANLIWTLEKSGSDYKFKTGTNYLYCTTTNNGVRVGANANNTFTLDTTGYLKNKSTSRYLGVYNNADWRCYTSVNNNISGQTFHFYAQQAGTTYTGYTTSVNTTVTYTLQSISISQTPTQTVFSIGEAFNHAGLAVTAQLRGSDGSTQQQNVTADVVVTAPNMTTSGTKTVTVSYTYNGVTKSANYSITVKAKYTLTYNKNTTDTVTGMPANVTDLVEGTVYTLSTQTPVRAGYDFYGWAASAGSEDSITTVTMNSNVTVYAIWLERTRYNVSFYTTDGTVTSTVQVYEGETIAAADVPDVTAPEGFTFVGWLGTTYSDPSAPTYLTPAGTTVNGNLQFHAVYAELGEGGSASEYELVTSTPTDWSGDYIIVEGNKGYAMSGTVNDGQLMASAVTVTSNKITNPANDIVWTIEAGTTSGQYSLKNKATGTYAEITGTGSKAAAMNVTRKYFTIGEASGKYKITSVSYPARCFAYYGTNTAFRTYAASNYSTGYLYKATASVVSYTTNPVSTKITVTWKNGTETVKTDRVAYGTPITAPAETPTKSETEQQYFEFKGWSETEGGAVVTSFPTASASLGDKTYFAVFETKTKLTVTWKNEDGTVLATQYYKAGQTPVYSGAEPTKASDNSFYYTFAGWNPTVSAVTASVTYTATFTRHNRFELTASLAKDTVKVGRSTRVNYTLTDMGVATTAHTPTFTVGSSAIASVDAAGKVSAVGIGTTTVTITFADCGDAQGNPLSATMNLTVVEDSGAGGYTLITQDNQPIDWSGDYIIMGKTGGTTANMNTWMLLTPDYDSGAPKLADGKENAATLTMTDDGAGVGTGTINDDGNKTSGVNKNIVMEDTDSDGIYDLISEIDDAYAFTIECIDDINSIYTIRVKDSNCYIACSASPQSGDNKLNFSSDATEYAQWRFSVQRVTKGGYNNDIITAQNVGNTTRRLYFNSVAEGGVNGMFRDYYTTAYSSGIGGGTNGSGAAYNLYLFGNPNPFLAQIYQRGEQITLVETGKVNSDALTAQLSSALTPDITGYPNWTVVGNPTWEIVENSSGNNMTVDATGLLTTNGSTAGSYALVNVAYTIHDGLNNTDMVVSTTAKVEVIAASATYSTVIYEDYTGMDTEVQYTIPNSMTQLPLAAYVVNDSTNATSKTGDVTMGGTLAWSATVNTGNSSASATIGADGILRLSGFTVDSIVTVTVSGATGNGVSAANATYKVYVKTADYTLTVNPAQGYTQGYDAATDTLTIAAGSNEARFVYQVVDDNGNGPSQTTFTLAGGAWSLSGDTYGATINSSGYLNLTNADRSADRILTVVCSRVAATDVATHTTKSNLTDSITVLVKASNQELMAVNDTVLIDWALPVTFDVLANDIYTGEGTPTVTAGTLPTGVTNNGNGSFTYTPSGWQTTDSSFTYTISGTVNGAAATASATVTLKAADSVYYEEQYAGIFTFSGNWTDVSDGAIVPEQSGDLTEIFGFDSNHNAYAKYSGGKAKQVTVQKGDKPSVSFTFAGTGFDVISATTNNTGAFLITVKDSNNNPAQDASGKKISGIYDTFRGYSYNDTATTRYGLRKVTRYAQVGTAYIPDASGSYYYDSETGAYVENTTWYTPAQGATNNFTATAESFAAMVDENGTYILAQVTSNWTPSTENTEASSFYQIPVIHVSDLPYGTYTVEIKPTFSDAYDRQGDGSYDFIFDGIRIFNPVANREAEYKYINLRDAVAAAGSFGSAELTSCDHSGFGVTDWTFYSRAKGSGNGAFTKNCTNCGSALETKYFHVEVTAQHTELGVGGYNDLPSGTVLSYQLIANDGDTAFQAMLTSICGTLTEYWVSGSGAVLTCTNNTSLITAKGAGTAYATLQLKDPTTNTVYASAVRSPSITVYADNTYTHTYSAWTHDANSDPATHSRSCTDAACDYSETENCSFTSAVTAQPTATETGVTTYTCDICGYSYTEQIPPLGGHSATFHVPTGADAPATQYANTATMPQAVAAPAQWNAHTYTFVGWLASTLNNSATAPTTIYTAGQSVDLTADTDFYALYTYTVAGAGSGWTKLTDLATVGAGTYALLTPNNKAFTGEISDAGHGQSTTNAFVFDADGHAQTAPEGTLELTIAAFGNGYTVYNEAYGYLYISEAKSGFLRWTNVMVNLGTWTFTTDNMLFNSNTVNGARLRVYNDTFRSYGTNSGAIVSIAVKGGGMDTYYTTELAASCAHTNVTTQTQEATCTTDGYIRDVCSDCGTMLESVTVEATGHSYGSAVHTGDPDVHTYTCSACSDSYTEDHSFTSTVSGDTTTYTCTKCAYSYSQTATYTVTFLVPDGQTAPASASGTTVTLPTMSDYTQNGVSYTFAGWVESSVDPTETAPTLHSGTYSLNANKMLYACYTYTATSGGSGDWELVTDAAGITSGNYVLVVKAGGTYPGSYTYYAIKKETISTSYVAAREADSFMGTGAAPATIAVTDDTIIYALEGTSSGFTLSNAEGTMSLRNSDNKLYFDASAVTTWKPTLVSGTSTFKLASGTRYLGLRTDLALNNGMPRFRCNSAASDDSYCFYLYKEGTGSGSGTATTYYTTGNAAPSANTVYTASVTIAKTSIAIGEDVIAEAKLYADGVEVVGALPAWTTSQSTVATIAAVNEICTVTGVAAGTTQIRATFTLPTGGTKASYKTVTVTSSGSTTSGDITYRYNGNYVYNWGQRGTTASFTTPYMAEYYTGSNTYASLAGLSGTTSTSAADIYNSPLGQALHTMLVDKQTSTTTYEATKNLYKYTDCELSADSISSFYSGSAIGPEWGSSPAWNREHTWPNSKGLDGADENDIMMLRPTSSSENTSRGNKAYGNTNSSTFYNPNNESNGTYDLRGDVARLMLQHMLRWGNTNRMFGSAGVMESRAVLLEWLAADPVDTWELGRSDAVQQITGVRNVFADYPELAFLLLGESVPANYPTPSNGGTRSVQPAQAPVSRETRTLTPNTSFGGAVIIDGKGVANMADDFAAYGPKYGIYLAPGQGLVFTLVSDKAITAQDVTLQIGAKAVNGTATSLDVATINAGVHYMIDGTPIASATEMYYTLNTEHLAWNGQTSSVVVVYNAGSGILDVTNIRYTAANGQTLSLNINEVENTRNQRRAVQMLRIVYGEPVTEPDPIQPDPAQELSFASARLVLKSDIAMEFNVNEDVFASAENVYAVFTKACYNDNGEITGYETATVTDAAKTDLGYSFRFEGINPAQMGSEVTAQLYGYRDGVLVSGKTVQYSVLSYINNQFVKSDDAAFRTLLANLAAYGAAAQLYTGYNTANLVTAAVSEGLMDYATTADPILTSHTAYESKEGEAVRITSAFLSLSDKVTVCFKLDASAYEGDIENLKLRVSYGDAVAEISGADFVAADGKYIASFSELNPAQMRTLLTVEVLEGETPISGTLTYSIESYAANKVGGNDALAALVKAMMCYGDAVESYFNH